MRVPAPADYFAPRLNRPSMPVEFSEDPTTWAIVVCPIAAAIGIAVLWRIIGQNRETTGGWLLYLLLLVTVPLGCLGALVWPVWFLVDQGLREIVSPEPPYSPEIDREAETAKENKWLCLPRPDLHCGLCPV